MGYPIVLLVLAIRDDASGCIAENQELVMAGGVILGAPPKRSPGLQNYPAADMQVQRTAGELWKEVDGKQVKQASFGKGMVLNGMNMKEAMNLLETPPDFVSHSATQVLYTHRATATTDIYFITNQSDQPVDFEPAFRTIGKQPELWDAVSGTLRTLPEYRTDQQHTLIPLKLDALQSAFIVFRRPAIGKNPV